jgi:hypothetical protein
LIGQELTQTGAHDLVIVGDQYAYGRLHPAASTLFGVCRSSDAIVTDPSLPPAGGRMMVILAAVRAHWARSRSIERFVDFLGHEQREHQENDHEREEKEEQSLGDRCRTGRDTGKAEDSGDERYDCEDQSPFQHDG